MSNLEQRLEKAKKELKQTGETLEIRDILLEVSAWLTKDRDFYIESGISADRFITQKLSEVSDGNKLTEEKQA